MLPVVLFQVALLREGLVTVLAFERPDVLVHPHVVEDAPAFVELLRAAGVPTIVVVPRLVRGFIDHSDSFVPVGLEELVIHLLFAHRSELAIFRSRARVSDELKGLIKESKEILAEIRSQLSSSAN